MDKNTVFSKNRILLTNTIEKDEMIDIMCQKLYEDQLITDRELFKKEIYLREKEYPTYVGHGIAIPHALSNTVQSAGVCFMKVAEGVNYEGGEKAHLIFMLAAPEKSQTHLKMLSTISANLMHEENRIKLLEADTVADIYNVLSGMLEK